MNLLLAGHEHACRTQHGLTEAVALLKDLGHGAGRDALDRLLSDGLVELRIECSPAGENGSTPTRSAREQIGVDELEPVYESGSSPAMPVSRAVAVRSRAEAPDDLPPALPQRHAPAAAVRSSKAA